MHDYTKLKVWEYSHNLTINIYTSTKSFPKTEQYGLVSQMRRASYSIPSNIVEGSSRDSRKEFIRFLSISLASAYELGYFLKLSKDLQYLTSENYEEIDKKTKEVIHMLRKLKTFYSTKV